MLVLTRKVGQRILIGGDVDVIVVGVRDGKVRLGIEAPDEVLITRDDRKVRGGSRHRAEGGSRRVRAAVRDDPGADPADPRD